MRRYRKGIDPETGEVCEECGGEGGFVSWRGPGYATFTGGITPHEDWEHCENCSPAHTRERDWDAYRDELIDKGMYDDDRR